MFEAIFNEKRLSEAARDLRARFDGHPRAVKFGGRGVVGLLSHGIWMDYWRNKKEKKHYFGFGLLFGEKIGPRIVEINMPISGVRPGFTGQVAVRDGKRWLCHWGFLRGEPDTIKTTMFDKVFDLGRKRNVAIDGLGNKRKFYKVACLDGDGFIDDLAEYVRACARVRSYWSGRKDKDLNETDPLLFEKKLGKTYVAPGRDPLVIDSKHDVVVSALADELISLGIQPSDKRQERRGPDLFFGKEGAKTGLFEVKTSTDAYAVYTGIGQLFFYGRLLKAPEMVALVVPGDLSEVDTRVLGGLGVRIIRYDIAGKAVNFSPSISAVIESK